MIKQIAILGGRFDPPHLGHYWVAQQVLESRLGINEVWFMPSFIHPWKKSQASVHDRVAMVSLVECEQIQPSFLEIEAKKISYTIDTVNLLQTRFHHTFYWIIGSDGIADFDKWKDVDLLMEKIQFIVFPRVGFAVNHAPSHFIVLTGNHLITTSISSSAVRGRIAQNKSITGAVLPPVEKYIYQHHLYAANK